MSLAPLLKLDPHWRRKTILISFAFVGIFILSLIAPSFRTAESLRLFLQELSLLLFFSCGAMMLTSAGLRDWSLGSVCLLAYGLMNFIQSKLSYYDQSLSYQLISVFVVPILLAGLGAFSGLIFWKSRVQHADLASLGLALLLGTIGFRLLPDFPLICNPWLCGDQLVKPLWIFIGIGVVDVAMTVAAIRYFWPRWFWIVPVSVLWLTSLLAVFVVSEYKGIPAVIFSVSAAVLGLYFVYHHMATGRWMIATGANPKAAETSGLPVGRTVLLTFGAAFFLVACSSIFEWRPIVKGEFTFAFFRQLDALCIGVLAGVGPGIVSLSGLVFASLVIGILNLFETHAQIDGAWIFSMKAIVLIAASWLEHRRSEH